MSDSQSSISLAPGHKGTCFTCLIIMATDDTLTWSYRLSQNAGQRRKRQVNHCDTVSLAILWQCYANRVASRLLWGDLPRPREVVNGYQGERRTDRRVAGCRTGLKAHNGRNSGCLLERLNGSIRATKYRLHIVQNIRLIKETNQ